jgi:hypothetical protein
MQLKLNRKSRKLHETGAEAYLSRTVGVVFGSGKELQEVY